MSCWQGCGSTPVSDGQHQLFDTAERPAGRGAASAVELDLRCELRDQLRAVSQCPGLVTHEPMMPHLGEASQGQVVADLLRRLSDRGS